MEFHNTQVLREHPKVIALVEKHRSLGHEVINVTVHDALMNSYLCSCGASFTPEQLSSSPLTQL
jgi:hypothetical protein